MSSIKRTCHGFSRVRFTRSGISSSLTPPSSTQLSLSEEKPAASAASTPRRVSESAPPRVSAEKRSGLSVSRLIFSRSTPAARSGAARDGSSAPFVVRHSSSIPGIARSIRQKSTIPRRTRGSPPVTRSFRTPSSAAQAAISRSSSSVQSSACGRLQTPRSGMQYTQRKLHRSVTEILSSVIERPKQSFILSP